MAVLYTMHANKKVSIEMPKML